MSCWPVRAAAEAEKVRTRLQHEVDEQRNPKTRATVNQLLDRYLETLDVGPRTGRDVLQAAIKLLRSSMTARACRVVVWGVPRILDRASRLRGSVHGRAASKVQSAVQG